MPTFRILEVVLYVKYNDIVASGVQNVSVVHSHCPECQRGMQLKHPMYVKYNDIVASGVQNVSVAGVCSTFCPLSDTL